jgi:hypothetical protein
MRHGPPRWHTCRQCVKDNRREVLFKSRTDYPDCYLCWLAVNPTPGFRRIKLEIHWEHGAGKGRRDRD